MRTRMEYKINCNTGCAVRIEEQKKRSSLVCITWMEPKPNRNKTFKRNFELKNVWPCKLHTKFCISCSHCLILFHSFASILCFFLQSISGPLLLLLVLLLLPVSDFLVLFSFFHIRFLIQNAFAPFHRWFLYLCVFSATSSYLSNVCDYHHCSYNNHPSVGKYVHKRFLYEDWARAPARFLTCAWVRTLMCDAILMLKRFESNIMHGTPRVTT